MLTAVECIMTVVMLVYVLVPVPMMMLTAWEAFAYTREVWYEGGEGGG